MVPRSQKVRLGVFLSITTFLLLVAIIVVTGNKLLKREKTYYIRYTEVSLHGLEIGTQVKYQGIRVGRIEDIFIDKKDIRSLIVQISIDMDVPIKEDTKAIMSLIGITGLKLIELQAGRNDAKELPPDSYIQAGQTLVETLSGQAEEIARKVERILNNLLDMTQKENQASLFELVNNASAALKIFNTTMESNENNIYDMLTNLRYFTMRLDSFMIITNSSMLRLNEILNSQEIAATMTNVSEISGDLKDADLKNLLGELNLTVQQIKQTFVHLDLTLLKSRHDLLSSIETLKESMEYFNEFSRLISENPSLLIYKTKQEEIREK